MKHIGPISGVAAFKGKWIATAGYDNQVILWDAATGKPVSRSFHDHLANQCAFSPTGELLVTASSDYTARVWSIPDLRLKAVLGAHDDDVEMGTFSPDGSRIATSSRDCTAGIFDLSGNLLTRLVGHSADVISITWSLDGKEAITSSDDGTIRRWDSNSGAQIGVIDLDGVETDTIAIGPTGAIFSGDDTGSITVVVEGTEKKIKAHEAGIKRLVLDPGGMKIASLSYDRRAIIWEINGSELVQISETTMPSIVWPRSAAFIDDTRMAFATFGSTYAIFDTATGAWQTDQVEPDKSINAVVKFKGDTYSVGDAGVVSKNGVPLVELGSLCNFLLPVGNTILTGGQMGVVFDALSGKTLYQHRSPLNCGVAYSVGGEQRAIIGAYTGEGLLFAVRDGTVSFIDSVQLHDNAVKGVGATDDRIFSVCANGSAALFEAATLTPVAELPSAHDRIANGCVGTSDGRFASISRDLKLRIWNGNVPVVVDTPHRNSIKCVTVSPDGRWVATGSYAGMVAIYDLAEKVWTTVTRPTAAGVSSIAPSDIAGAFLASSYDGEVYEVSTSPAVRAA